jgi:hypothetical protein
MGVVSVKEFEWAMDSWAAARLIDLAVGVTAEGRTKEGLKRELLRVAAGFVGPNPSPIEKLLAGTAAINWFALRMLEVQYADAITGDGVTLDSSEHHQRRIDRTHRRLMSTIKTLATVRRLAVPAVQINVARQQVNQLKVEDSP